MGSPYSVPGSVPFVSGTYDRRPGERIVDLILRGGDIQANREARSGEIWGSAINQLGQIGAQALERHQQDQDKRQLGQAISSGTSPQYPSATQPGPPGSGAPIDPGSYQGPPGMTPEMSGRVRDSGANHQQQILDAIDPKLRPAAVKGMQDLNESALKVQESRVRVQQMQTALDESNRKFQMETALHWGQTATNLEPFMNGPDGGIGAATYAVTESDNAGIPVPDQVRQLVTMHAQGLQQAGNDPAAVAQIADSFRQRVQPLIDRAKMMLPKKAPIKGSPGDVFLDPNSMAPVAAIPEKAAKTGTFEDYIVRKFGPQPTPEQIEGARQKWAQEGHVTVVVPGQAEDTKTIATLLAHGLMLPSELSKRSANYNSVIAQANAISKAETGKPINMAKLQLDYDAARRFAGSMNGPQMVRFKGLAGSVVNTIDEVKRLSEELQQGSIQKWNSAKRSTILQLYGNTPQSGIAAQYLAAVNTLKSEYASLEQGGMTPTEPSWKLANQQINEDFGVKDLSASLTETQRLINYRLGAFDELGPSQVGGGGQTFGGGPAPAAPAAAPAPAAKAPVRIKGDADFAALPSGTEFIGPDGVKRRKP